MGQKASRRAVLVVAAFSLFEALTHFGNANPFRGDPALGFDSPFYIRMLYYLAGRAAEPPTAPFCMRPLVPALALPLSPYVGINNAFGTVNTIFWALTSVLLFEYCLSMTGDSRVALCSSLLFSSSVPVLVYGGAIGTDMAGYFFLILGLYIALRGGRGRKTYLVEGAVIGIGMLCRETTSVLIPITLLVRLARDRLPLRDAFEELLTVSSISALPVAAWWLAIPNPGYTKYFAQNLAVAFTYAKLERAFYQVMFTFHVCYAYFLVGFLKERDYRSLMESYAVLGVASAYFVAIYFIGVLSSRFVFMAFPAFLTLGAKGVLSLGEELSRKPLLGRISSDRWGLLLLIVYALISNVGTAEYNICFPSTSDAQIEGLLP